MDYDKMKEKLIYNFENKYKMLLSVLNKILVNIGKAEIIVPSQFININRSDLVKEENMKIIEDMEEDIKKIFNNSSAIFGLKNMRQNFVLTLLKSMCEELELSLKSYACRKKDENGKWVAYVVYNIFCE